jgi:hypothetical protein
MTVSAAPALTRPVKPERPAAYLHLCAEERRTVRAFAVGLATFDDVAHAGAAVNTWLNTTPAGRTFRTQVITYNAAARAFNAQLRAQLVAARQAEAAASTAAAVGAVRARRCPRCFTVPAASGVCNCE